MLKLENCTFHRGRLPLLWTSNKWIKYSRIGKISGCQLWNIMMRIVVIMMRIVGVMTLIVVFMMRNENHRYYDINCCYHDENHRYHDINGWNHDENCCYHDENCRYHDENCCYHEGEIQKFHQSQKPACVRENADVAIRSMLITEIAENLWISKDWNLKCASREFWFQINNAFNSKTAIEKIYFFHQSWNILSCRFIVSQICMKMVANISHLVLINGSEIHYHCHCVLSLSLGIPFGIVYLTMVW